MHAEGALTEHGDATRRDATRSRWQLVAAGLAAASALISLVFLVDAAVPGAGQLPGAQAPLSELLAVVALETARGIGDHTVGLLTGVAVPALGAWLASRRDALRAGLGLAAVATWGALELPGMVPPTLWEPQWLAVARLGSSGLAVVALATALLALRAHVDRHLLHAVRARRTAAAGVAVWGLAGMGSSLLTHVAVSAEAGLEGVTGRPPLAMLLVLLGVAAVVWRRTAADRGPAGLVVRVP